jgi:hypothetical protein
VLQHSQPSSTTQAAAADAISDVASVAIPRGSAQSLAGQGAGPAETVMVIGGFWPRSSW